MKKVNFLVAAAVVALGSVFTSCSKTENAVPTITFSASAGSMSANGDTLVLASGATTANFTYTVAAEAEVKTLQAGITGSLAAVSAAEGETTYSSSAISIPSTSASYTVKVVDKDANEVTKILYIKAKAVTGGAISTYTAKFVGAQDNTTAGSSFNSSTGEVLLQAAAKAASGSVDFIYYFDATAKAEFFAPTSETCKALTSLFANTFTTKNATKLAVVTMTTAEFDAVSDDIAIKAKATGITTDVVTGLAVDKVFAFITAAGKQGLVKVTALDAKATGSITISVKVQK